MPNAFATSVSATNFRVTNNTTQLGNQYVLVYLTPEVGAENWLYAAWQQLNPGQGGTQSFTLNQAVSGQMESLDGTYTTNTLAITPGYVSELTNGTNLQATLQPPVLGTTAPPPQVTSSQSGMQNATLQPSVAMNALWYVNGNLTCKSISPVSAGNTLSAFELDTTLYWAVGNAVEGPNYTYNQITPLTKYVLPANTPLVNVSLIYANSQFQFDFQPGSN